MVGGWLWDFDFREGRGGWCLENGLKCPKVQNQDYNDFTFNNLWVSGCAALSEIAGKSAFVQVTFTGNLRFTRRLPCAQRAHNAHGRPLVVTNCALAAFAFRLSMLSRIVPPPPLSSPPPASSHRCIVNRW
jgi:hypothetical protein